MSKPRYGDHISVKRWGGLYEHHGIYVGKDKVIHSTNDLGIFGKVTHLDSPEVKETSFQEFLDGNNEYKVHLYDNAGNERKTINKNYKD